MKNKIKLKYNDTEIMDLSSLSHTFQVDDWTYLFEFNLNKKKERINKIKRIFKK